VLYDIEDLATDLHESLAELAEVAGTSFSAPTPHASTEEILATQADGRSLARTNHSS
jgi:hypothetical protein